MWKELKRIIKPNWAIVLFGSEPFSSALRISNIKMYKYDWIWESNKSPNFAQAPYMPLKNYENIIVFSNWWCAHPAKNRMIYNPQWTTEINKVCNQKKAWIFKHKWWLPTSQSYVQKKTGYPVQIIKINKESKTVHPTQKPVALLEYLIRTYTLEWETVLDFTIGSGTTAIAAINTNRNYIGFEMDKWYFDIAQERITTHYGKIPS